MLALIQARTSSKRLSNKILRKLFGKPIIKHVIDRVKKSKRVEKIIVVTSKNRSDDKLVDYLSKIKCNFYRGSLNNVARRAYEAANKNNSLSFLRISADSPLIDPFLIDKIISLKNKKKYKKYDLITNIFPRKFPRGQSVEIINTRTLFKNLKKMSKNEKEHVTKYFYNNHKDFLIKNFFLKKKIKYKKLAIDTLKDLNYMNKEFDKNKIKKFSIFK